MTNVFRLTPFVGDDFDRHAYFISNQVRAEIESIPEDYLLKVSRDDLVHHLYDKYAVDKLSLDKDSLVMDEPVLVAVLVPDGFDARSASKVRGRSFACTWDVSGNPELWQYAPNSRVLGARRIEVTVTDKHLSFKLDYPDRDLRKEQIEADRTEYINGIIRDMSSLNDDVERCNKAVRASIEARVDARMKEAKRVRGVLDGLSFPFRRRAEEPIVVQLPTKKRPVPRPLVKSGPIEICPSLSDDDSNYVLEVLKQMSINMERSPATFAKLNEEEIRDHFLMNLNGHFQGQATGETFNARGKTDIILKDSGTTVFIAECKFWRGEQSYADAINQLMSYLTWRDTKVAILVFNRNKNASLVSDKMRAHVRSRSDLKRVVDESRSDGVSKYVFLAGDDPNREIFVTSMLFDIPVDGECPGEHG